jgi:hypothetical protein
MTVVVTGRGSSPEPIWEGSTYLRVVKSVNDKSVAGFQRLRFERNTLLLVDLGLDIEVDAQDDHVGHDVQSPDAEEYIRVVERNPLGNLHHPEDDDEVGNLGSHDEQEGYAGTVIIKGSMKKK